MLSRMFCVCVLARPRYRQRPPSNHRRMLPKVRSMTLRIGFMERLKRCSAWLKGRLRYALCMIQSVSDAWLKRLGPPPLHILFRIDRCISRKILFSQQWDQLLQIVTIGRGGDDLPNDPFPVCQHVFLITISIDFLLYSPGFTVCPLAFL